MRYIRETGAAMALTIALGGCTANDAPVEAPSASAATAPESSPSPILPIEPLGLDACSSEVAIRSLLPEENPEYYVEELRGATQEDLSYVLLNSLGTLATVSEQARVINPSGNIEVPNLQQPNQSFEHTVDLNAGTLSMTDTVLEDPMCQISAVETVVIKPHEESVVSVEFDEASYAFVYNPTALTTGMQDGRPLTPEAVGTFSMIANRYARIAIDAATAYAPIEA